MFPRMNGSRCRFRRWSIAKCSRPCRRNWRRTAGAAGRGERFLLQGLIVCKQCGYAYYGKAISLAAGKGRRRDYAYYRYCGSDAYRFGGQRLCSNPQVRTDRLDAAVWREVEDLLGDPRRLAAEYERRLVEFGKGDPSRSDAALLDGQIAKLNRGIGRLIDSYAEGLIDKTEFEPRLTGLRQRLAGLEQQRQALLDQEALRSTLSLLVGRLEDFADQVRGQLAQVDWHRQRELIRLLVKRVEIDRDAISIVFRVAPLSAHPSRDGPQMPFLPDCRRGEMPVNHQHLNSPPVSTLLMVRSGGARSEPTFLAETVVFIQ